MAHCRVAGEHFWSPASPGPIWSEMARFGRAPNRSNFLLTPLFKSSIFGPRQARGRFGSFLTAANNSVQSYNLHTCTQTERFSSIELNRVCTAASRGGLPRRMTCRGPKVLDLNKGVNRKLLRFGARPNLAISDQIGPGLAGDQKCSI